jgi:hypothetical protein
LDAATGYWQVGFAPEKRLIVKLLLEEKVDYLDDWIEFLRVLLHKKKKANAVRQNTARPYQGILGT